MEDNSSSCVIVISDDQDGVGEEDNDDEDGVGEFRGV